MSACYRHWVRLGTAATLVGLLCLAGCSSDPEKDSLFDHEHDLPDHWPAYLGDTAVKMRERLERLDEDGDSRKELFDLVSWAPELAADTSLPEAQWNPIYEASESLRLELLDSEGEWDSGSRQKVEQLCVLIDAAWGQLPEDEKQASRERGHHHHHHHHDDHGDHDHGDHDHDHGDHDHDHGDHDHDHGDHDHDHGDHDHDHGDHDHDHGDHGHHHGEKAHDHEPHDDDHDDDHDEQHSSHQESGPDHAPDDHVEGTSADSRDESKES